MEKMLVEEEEEEKEQWFSPMVHLRAREGMISCSKRRAFLQSYPLCSHENSDAEINGECYDDEDEDESNMCAKKSCKRMKALLHPLTLMLLRRLKRLKEKALLVGAYYTSSFHALKIHMTGCHGFKLHIRKCN